MNSPSQALLLAGMFVFFSGCGTTEKHFNVTSFPEGATIFVDGEPRGQTNTGKLRVDFGNDEYVAIRLQKDGFQTTGQVLSSKSPSHLAFFLQETPSNQDILNVLRGLQRLVDQMSRRLDTEIAGKNDR